MAYDQYGRYIPDFGGFGPGEQPRPQMPMPNEGQPQPLSQIDAGGSSANSLQEILWQQEMKNRQDLARRDDISGRLAMADVGLQRIGQFGQDQGIIPGSNAQHPWGGEFTGGQNPGLTYLMQLLQSSNNYGWGR